MVSAGTQAKEWIAKHCPISTPERPHNAGAVSFQCGPRPSASIPPEDLLEIKFSGSIPDLLNQKLLGWALQSVLTSPPGDSDACLSLRITALEHPKR